MSVKWLIEKNIKRGDNVDALAEIVRAKGMECVRLEYIPFSQSFIAFENGKPKKIYSSNMPYRDGECVVVIGTLNICELLLEPKRWTPTVWMNMPNFRVSKYSEEWKEFLLQPEYKLIDWQYLDANLELNYNCFGVDDCVFVKPNENLKKFSGAVVKREDFAHWYEQNQDCYEIRPDDAVIIAKPIGIKREWRFIVCDREVITGSLYKEDGKVNYQSEFPDEAKKIAEKIAAHPWQPDSAYACDIAQSGDGFYLLECGPFNGAGLYKCDFNIIVDKISALALKEWELAKQK